MNYWLEYIQSKSYAIGNDELSRARENFVATLTLELENYNNVINQ